MSFIDSFLKGHALAEQEHKATIDEAFQRQMREYELAKAKHDVNAFKLQDQLAEIQGAMAQHQLQQQIPGRPGPLTTDPAATTYQSAPMEGATPATPPADLSQPIKDILSKPAPLLQAVPGPAHPQPLPGPDIQIPSLGLTIPGTNEEQAKADAAAASEAQKALTYKYLVEKLGPGERIVEPSSGKTLVEGGPAKQTGEEQTQALAEDYFRSVNKLTPGTVLSPAQKAVALPLYKAYGESLKKDDTQKYVDAYTRIQTGQPQPGDQEYVKAIEHLKSTKGESTILIQTVDENGNPVQKIVPKIAGSEFVGRQTAQEQNRQDQAAIITREADRILSMIDKTPNAVGPIMGRLARGETVIGTVSPEAKALGTALGSFEALQPILHGFRGGGQTVEHFHSVLGDQRLNAAALKASINEIKALAANIKGGKAVEEAAPAAGANVIRYDAKGNRIQ